MNETLLKNYADLLVKRGVNLQKGQEVVIRCDVDTAHFARIVAKSAYENGASNVVVRWDDEYMTKLFYENTTDEKLKNIPNWIVEFYKQYDKEKACYISLISDDPDLFKDINPERIKEHSKAVNKALKDHSHNAMSNAVHWTVAAVSSPKWALKVYPDLSEEDAVNKLWEAILNASRVDDENTLKNWDSHVTTFEKRTKYLNDNAFKYLKYKNSIGTDVVIELPKNHIWIGGSEKGKDGIFFSANIPSEEVFTVPVKTGTKGTVVASMPLVYKGKVIEGIEFVFENGKIVSAKAKTNEEILKGILETDEGALMLGEVAIVQHDSPISNMKTLFYETLFDENAACHFAFGKAYPCIKDADNLSEKELSDLGINDSLVHVDFMIGTSDLSITGIKENGEEIEFFKNGNFFL